MPTVGDKVCLEATSSDYKPVSAPITTDSQRLGLWAFNVDRPKSPSNPPLATCVALGKLLDLSELQFLISGVKIITSKTK